ncbi:MAG: DUF5672 family protein [Akkermansiaceae bacterium]|nr:DUF5672 family protein [Akkermansiaceae bacterium]
MRLLQWAFSRTVQATKRVAVVVPWSDREQFTADEEISIRHLLYYLGGHDKYLLVPRGSGMLKSGFQVVRLAKRYFGSPSSHDRLLYKIWFYKKFLAYEFILFYHLDSLVLEDNILKWCSGDFDFIGPPWIKCEDSPWVEVPRVGNGGFSMLRVSRAIEVLTSRYRVEPATLIHEWFGEFCPMWVVDVLTMFRGNSRWFRVKDRLLEKWNESRCPTSYGRGNDQFWADKAVKYVSKFRVATLEEGLRFGFEVSPQTCYEMAGNQMPFGCHAWVKYDREFWQPHLLSDAPKTVTPEKE